ncbi:MAG: carboxypeptidase M32 [Candidatus Sumerlaeaceae bacterium]|nr:carboxypeptidase M32 [Candidatus Sumerlaeaceae bacterium]
MTTPETSYEELKKSLREISLLGSTASVLHWDEQTYMPPAGAEYRAEQVSLLARMVHEQFTAPRIGELLAAVEGSTLIKDPESDAAANTRETRRSYDRATRLPSAFVEELSRVTSLAHHAWVEARKTSDFAAFQPWLEKIIVLKREEADLVGHKGNRYDALLDEYEPNETADGVRAVFESLRGSLVELVGKIMDSGRKAPVEILERHYPAAKQEQLAREAAARVGFDFNAGRLDVSVHPFCTGLVPGDTRITTRYDESYFGDAFFGVLHETGHALYDQGLNKDAFGLPVGEAVSLGIHESQSRMWENLVGRSRAFWKFFLPRTREVLGSTLDGVSDDDWYFAINDVRPSFIRTESDEVTYNLHVLLRFELEEALLSGDLTPADVPDAWNEKVRKYLGITPPDHARGCLQDVHWSGGSFGYFPTYTLGNLYAAQLFEAARRDLGDLDGQIASGSFAPLLGWLRGKIHRHGKRYTPRELARRATGQELSADALLDYLRKKTGELYGI